MGFNSAFKGLMANLGGYFADDRMAELLMELMSLERREIMWS